MITCSRSLRWSCMHILCISQKRLEIWRPVLLHPHRLCIVWVAHRNIVWVCPSTCTFAQLPACRWNCGRSSSCWSVSRSSWVSPSRWSPNRRRSWLRWPRSWKRLSGRTHDYGNPLRRWWRTPTTTGNIILNTFASWRSVNFLISSFFFSSSFSFFFFCFFYFFSLLMLTYSVIEDCAKNSVQWDSLYKYLMGLFHWYFWPRCAALIYVSISTSTELRHKIDTDRLPPE